MTDGMKWLAGKNKVELKQEYMVFGQIEWMVLGPMPNMPHKMAKITTRWIDPRYMNWVMDGMELLIVIIWKDKEIQSINAVPNNPNEVDLLKRLGFRLVSGGTLTLQREWMNVGTPSTGESVLRMIPEIKPVEPVGGTSQPTSCVPPKSNGTMLVQQPEPESTNMPITKQEVKKAMESLKSSTEEPSEPVTKE
jgi:hypothetical protein